MKILGGSPNSVGSKFFLIILKEERQSFNPSFNNILRRETLLLSALRKTGASVTQARRNENNSGEAGSSSNNAGQLV